ncbi:MAG TPA: hypothetical protein VF085_07505 [Solirubrobacterales bacterium]
MHKVRIVPTIFLVLFALAVPCAAAALGAGSPIGPGSLGNDPAGTASQVHSCGQVSATYPDVEDGSGLELIRVHAISCKRARHVAVECIKRYHVPGWHAYYDRDSLGHLRKGRKRIVVKGIAGGAPHCIPPPSPRIHLRGYRQCGQIGSSAGWGYGDIRAYGLSCAAARAAIRSWKPDEPHGWTLRHGRHRDEFHKGHKRITGVPLGD